MKRARITSKRYGKGVLTTRAEMQRQLSQRPSLIEEMICMKILKVKEATVERYLVKRVKALGGEIRKVVFPGHTGAPDRVVFFNTGCGYGATCGPPVLWIELKSPVGVLKLRQLREHRRLRDLGQRVTVIKSKEEVDCLLGSIDV
jgi:hypothetical protein